jgi:amino acid transporter
MEVDAPVPLPDPAPSPRRRLTLLDCTCIIVGIIIGAGFYETTPQVARGAGGAAALLAVWLVGGAVSLVGALCYAELTAAYPRDGGEYVFLTRAFGRRAGFLFAWAGFWVVRPGNIGAMGYVFARYAQQLLPLPLGRHAPGAYAVGAVLVLSGINVVGLRTGKWTQNLLTVVKVIGLLAIFSVGLLTVSPHSRGATPPPVPPASMSVSGLYLALILVLFTYGGWNEMSYVAAEVRDPRRNVLRALVAGTLAVTAIYVLGNVAFVRALGFDGLAASQAVAADVLRPALGGRGAAAISALVCVSCLGALNGMILTGARIYYAVGTEHPAFAWLGAWNERRGTPVRSLALQAAVTVALIAGFGLHEDGFERMVVFTAPLYWLFLLLGGVSLFVLRRVDAETERPYRVAGYPLTPALFCVSSAFLLYASLQYALAHRAREAWWAIALMGAGVLASLYDPVGRQTGSEEAP